MIVTRKAVARCLILLTFLSSLILAARTAVAAGTAAGVPGPAALAWTNDLQINGGKMDGFVTALDRVKACANGNISAECALALKDNPGVPDVMGFHNAQEIPNYWAYAKHYLLQDRMFAPTDAWTLSSHLYLVSAWSAKCTNLTTPDPDASSCVTNIEHPGGMEGQPFGVVADMPYRWASIPWLLDKKGVSWAYYVGEDTCLAATCENDGPHATPRSWMAQLNATYHHNTLSLSSLSLSPVGARGRVRTRSTSALNSSTLICLGESEMVARLR